MKLFLTSLAISKTQGAELIQLVGKPSHQIKLALIENAADPYPENSRSWAIDNNAAINSHGFQVTNVDLRNYLSDASGLKSKLSGHDVIWLSGGNTYYLRWILKASGADGVIIHLVNQGTIYGGGSAGAIMSGPSLQYFDAVDDPTAAPELIQNGLQLTQVVVIPHSGNAKYSIIMKNINNQLRHAGFDTVPLNDNQALVVNDGAQRIIEDQA